MKQTNVANILNGAAQTVLGDLVVSLPVGASPVTVYRRIFYLRFPAMAQAEGIRIDQDETDLQMSFKSLDLDANGAFESDLIAAVDSIDLETVSVRLDTIRRIKKVQLSPDKVTDVGHVVEFYSLRDGEIVVGPQAVYNLNNGLAELSDDFSAERFALRLKGPGHSVLPLAPDDLLRLVGEHTKVASVMALDGQTKIIVLDRPRRILEIRFSDDSNITTAARLEFYRLDGNTTSEKPSFSAAISNRTATLSDDFADGRFAVRVKKSDGAFLYRSSWEIRNIIVRSHPTCPRLGIAAPADLISDHSIAPAAPLFFWQLPGEIRIATGVHSPPDIGKALADGLQRYLDNYFDRRNRQTPSSDAGLSPSETVSAAMVFESDLPCRLEIAELQVGYHLKLKNPFPAGQDKHALRFTEAVPAHRIEICLPAKSKVSSARMRTVESFKPHRPHTVVKLGSFEPEIAERTGAYLCVEKWVAQCINMAQALVVSGIQLGLLTLVDTTELLVQVRGDWRGMPLGTLLFESAHKQGGVGRGRWSRLQFPQAIELFAQPYWLLVKATRGEAVWLTRTAKNAVHVLTHPDNQRVALLEGRAGLFEWLMPLKSGEVDKDHSMVKLKIGDQIITPETAEKGNQIYNLTASLNAYIQVAEAGSSLMTIPLIFTTAMPGIITVHPPEIDFLINT